MNEKDNGGRAFPSHPGISYGGMSLRDYFAAKALQGLLADYEVDAGEGESFEDFAKEVASVSYEYADAMMEARI
jgi:hypothetical protein